MVSFVKALDHDRIVAAIGEAESKSTGQIRVHITNRRVREVETAAAGEFEKLGMTATKERNGVLIYVAPRARRFAVIGDKAIHERCGPQFWKDVASAMENEFRRERFTEAIVEGVARAGHALAEHFPRRGEVGNELPDEVTED
jgi:uncharacterized membrane protein